MSTKVLIIIPTYNEAERISQTLLDLSLIGKSLAGEFEIDILHVDDNSPDGTAHIATSLSLANFHQILRPGKGGLGPAYIAGFKWALARDFQIVVEMDADGSHLATELPGLLHSLDGAGLVIGTRWITGGSVVNWPWYRQLISKVGTRYAQIALQLPFRDLTSGFRAFTRETLANIPLDRIQSKGYGFQIELVMQASQSGSTIKEFPITFFERTVGRSKMTYRIALEALAMITKWGIQKRLRLGIFRR